MRVHPRWSPTPTRSRRCDNFNAVFVGARPSATSCSTAARRRVPDRLRGARRRHRRGGEPGQGHPRLARLVRQGPASGPSTSCDPRSTSTWSSRTVPASSPRSPGVFGTHGVSIRSMEQESLDSGDSGPASPSSPTPPGEADLRSTLGELRGLDAVRSVGSVLRGHRLGLTGSPCALRLHPRCRARARLLRRAARRPGRRRWPVPARDAGPSFPPSTSSARPGYPEVAARVMWPFVDGDVDAEGPACSGRTRPGVISESIVAEAYATFDTPDVCPVVPLGLDRWGRPGPTCTCSSCSGVRRLRSGRGAAAGQAAVRPRCRPGANGSACSVPPGRHRLCRPCTQCGPGLRRHRHPVPRRSDLRGAAPANDHPSAPSTRTPSRCRDIR